MVIEGKWGRAFAIPLLALYCERAKLLFNPLPPTTQDLNEPLK